MNAVQDEKGRRHLSPAASQDDAQAILTGYRRILRRRLAVLLLLTAITLFAFLLDLVTGPSNLSIPQAVQALLFSQEVDASTRVIVWEVRLPYALMAVLVGIALSLAGAEMQTILNNPLASPFTLGVSSAASLGAALAIVLGIGIPGVPDNWIISGNAFLFAFGSVLMLQALSRLRGTGVETLVLFGIALVFTFNALVALIQFVASQEALQQLVFWSMGSLARSNWEKLTILGAVLLVVAPFSFAAAWPMTALRLGEERARSFGVNVTRLRFASLFRISILAATAVSFVGTIGFIGLVGPHIARLLIGEDHRFFLPVSALAGAGVMSLASVASKTLMPGVLVPVGIVTALIGVPVFLGLILSKRERT
ncbi:iron ABC transporter permease [Telmatospirillum sp. J64-1]|uniref:FecCD family ABC transporter permease n=1 Tax=Telmatospirillum sp. J64-1 TaxID=2502183 RepID=UPI00115D7E9A|nr:iron ABC transporter permease [Telmatospirillum sp. J64-1]